jgi:hypothetical protein
LSFIRSTFKENPLKLAHLNPLKDKLSSVMGVFCLVFLILFSQYVGWVHNFAHARVASLSRLASPASQDWSMRNLAESHFVFYDLKESRSESVSISCKLFDSLMLGVCLASLAFGVKLLELGFGAGRALCEVSHQSFLFWAYSSRAPPV